ncbi:MAG: hypothetical protein WAP35_09245 [Solirubrobacterales bacterium]
MIAGPEHIERSVKKLPRRKAVRALKAAALRDLGFKEYEIAKALGWTVRTLYSDRKELEAAIAETVAESHPFPISDTGVRKTPHTRPGGRIDHR